MPITSAPTVVGSNGTTSEATTIDATSVSMVAGRAYIATVSCHKSAETAITCSSISNTGTGQTWTSVRAQVAEGSEFHLSTWRCVATATQSVTVTGNLSATGSASISVIELPEGEVDTDDLIVQSNSATGSGFSVSSIGTTLTSTDPDNLVLAIVHGWDFTTGTISPDGSLVEIDENTHAGSNVASHSVSYVLDTDDSPSVTFSATRTLGSIIAIEIRASSGSSPPVLSSTNPADNATDVDVNTTLTLNFDVDVAAGTGNVEVYETDGDTLVEAIDITDGGQVTIIDDQVIVEITSPLDPGTDYYVLVDDGAIVANVGGGEWSGISLSTNWNFTTAAAPITDVAPVGPVTSAVLSRS